MNNILFHITIWTCCIASIIVRPHSDLVANILLGIELLCFVVYLIVFAIQTIITNRKIRKMKREIALMLLSRKLGGKDDIKE